MPRPSRPGLQLTHQGLRAVGPSGSAAVCDNVPMTESRLLIAVVGATATGKSDVALALAQAFDGEVIGADAYQLYRGLDIGTAKLDAVTRTRIPHHLIDVADA